MSADVRMALCILFGGAVGFIAGRHGGAADVHDGAPSAVAFHCETKPTGGNDARLCYTNVKACAGKDAKPCFERPRAWCFNRSMLADFAWSRTETTTMCFPSATECSHDHEASGTGSIGQPPVKGPCVEVAADEVRE